ncbi:helix-turn-helix domain-containing protein [Embleya sp. NPDC050154]|uniref:helix-turn-helix domain-containing protein n=1 Tax=Embleya sp. NPDC050154 TaxID=3363988 RepID=UPI003787B0C7
MSIGQSLAEARVRAGLTVERLSEVTRIRQVIIEGVERDDFEPCGGDFYARGHIRTLARATGLEPDPLIAEYDHTVGGTSTPRPTEIFDSPRKSIEYRQPNWTLAMGVAVVIVLIFAFVQLAGGRADDDKKETASRVAPTTTALVAPAPPPPPPPVEPSTKTPEFPAEVVVTITAVDGRSWIRAFDAENKQIFETILNKGEAKTLTDPEQLKLQIGNSGAARLNVNGKDLGPAGEEGDVAQHTFVPGDPLPQMRTSASAEPSPTPTTSSARPSPTRTSASADPSPTRTTSSAGASPR